MSDQGINAKIKSQKKNQLVEETIIQKNLHLKNIKSIVVGHISREIKKLKDRIEFLEQLSLSFEGEYSEEVDSVVIDTYDEESTKYHINSLKSSRYLTKNIMCIKFLSREVLLLEKLSR